MSISLHLIRIPFEAKTWIIPMQILRTSDLIETPWKNGGGVTRNIAARMDGDAIIWRLSMADVAKAGPFSNFDGLTRILTVIDGTGMSLHSEGETWPADLAVPVTFDGSATVNATLGNGPIRDFNLMFDPTRCVGSAHCVTHAGTLASSGQTAVLHVIKGTATLDESGDVLAVGDTAIKDGAPLMYNVSANACVLTITLQVRR
jgi:environmental stress-induced protein Ves